MSLLDLTRDLRDVVARLPQWERGDFDEAAAETLAVSARSLHERQYTLWVWTASTDDGEPAWALPIPIAATVAFAPRGPARALARCLAAARLADARLDDVSLGEWRGWTLLVAPGLDAGVGEEALAIAHPDARSICVEPMPMRFAGMQPLDVSDRPPAGGPSGRWDILDLARETRVHPIQVALALASHDQDASAERFDPAIVTSLRIWGCDGPPEEPPPPSYAIEDDPCPRRRHARRALQRLLGMKKIGALYHTEFDHFAKGAPPSARGDALEVGEALVRAGLLGAKQSVGQLHVYLRRDALGAIHALIDRGEVADERLASLWTAPAPGTSGPSQS